MGFPPQPFNEHELRGARELAFPETPPVDVTAGDMNGSRGRRGKFASIAELQLPVLGDAGIALAFMIGHEFGTGRKSRDARIELASFLNRIIR
jgi:hypothetical protein